MSADFSQAMEWIRDGHCVRRKKWIEKEQHSYWCISFLDNRPIWHYKINKYGKVLSNSAAVLHQEHLNATDWELIE
jgi:hypothetical protein